MPWFFLLPLFMTKKKSEHRRFYSQDSLDYGPAAEHPINTPD